MSEPLRGRVALALKALRGNTRATLRDKDSWFTRSLIGVPNASGQIVTPKSALGLSAYFACIRNISDDLAKTPIRMVQRDSTGTLSAVNSHPALRLVSERPNPMMTPMDFWATLIAHMLGWQGGFAEIVRDDLGNPLEMWPIDPTTVTVLWDVLNKTLIYEVRGDGRFIQLRPEQVFHIHGLGFDGFTSFVMAEVADLSIGRALATQEFSAAFFGNGATLKAVLEAPPTLTEKGLELLRSTFSTRHAGAENAYKTAILPDGVKYQAISTDPEKSQLIAAMHDGVEGMARLFRMPLAKIQHDIRSTFNNVTEQNKFYQHDTLSGPGKRITEECKAKLLPLPSDKNKRFKYDFAELLEADPVAQADVELKEYQTGQWTSNQLREKHGRKGFGADGDRYFVMSNLMPLDKIDDEPEPTTPPDEPADPPAEDVEPEPDDERATDVQEFRDATDALVDTISTMNGIALDFQQATTQETERDRSLDNVTKLFRHDFRRFANTEEHKSLRAMGDNNLKSWMKGFYPGHEEFVAQTLETRYAVTLAFLGVDGDATELAGKMARSYIESSRERIEAGAKNENIDTLDRFAGEMAARAVLLAQGKGVAA